MEVDFFNETFISQNSRQCVHLGDYCPLEKQKYEMKKNLLRVIFQLPMSNIQMNAFPYNKYFVVVTKSDSGRNKCPSSFAFEMPVIMYPVVIWNHVSSRWNAKES